MKRLILSLITITIISCNDKQTDDQVNIEGDYDHCELEESKDNDEWPMEKW